MNKNTYKRKTHKKNVFSGGGETLNSGAPSGDVVNGILGGVGAIAGTAARALPNTTFKQTGDQLADSVKESVYGSSLQDPLARMMGDLTGASTKQAVNTINNAANNSISAIDSSNTDSLLSSYDNMLFMNKMKVHKGNEWKTGLSFALGAPWLDFDENGNTTFSADNLGASFQGAMNGASGGPWGMLAGGIVGGVANLVSRFGRNSRIRKANAATEMANTRMRAAFDNANNNLQLNMINSNLATYAAEGGQLSTHGTVFDNGLTFFNTGGTHELNPNEGILLGYDLEGTPNLVEEGEVKWNDYIFSNRLKATELDLEDFNLPKKYKGKTFADIAKKLGEESKERPNDPISKKGLNDAMSKLQQSQEAFKQRKLQAELLNAVNENPELLTALAQQAGQAQQMELALQEQAMAEQMQAQGLPSPEELAMMELQGMMAPEGYAFGGNLFYNGDYLYRNLEGIDAPFTSSYANLQDPLFIRNQQRKLNRLYLMNLDPKKLEREAEALEAIEDRARREAPITYHDPVLEVKNNYTDAELYNSKAPLETGIPELDNITGATKKPKDKKSKYATWLRYAPVAGSALGVLGDVANMIKGPDYSHADAIDKAGRNIRNAEAPKISDYVKYKPIDLQYYTNLLNANASATRRAIMNGSSPSRYAALLAADSNYINDLGKLGMLADLINYDRLLKSKEFNRGTNMTNADLNMKAQLMNMANDAERLKAAIYSNLMRDAIDTNMANSMSANLTNLFDNLGNIGWENMNFNMLNSNVGEKYGMDKLGWEHYKKSDNRNGGYLTIKNKRRKK